MKRIMALALALIMVLAITACGSKKRQPIQLTLSTEDSEAILAAAGIALPDVTEAPGAYSNVQWFCWGDPFQNYSEDEMVNTGYWTFKNKYECDITYVETTYSSRNDDLARLITGGTPPDLCSGGSNATAIYPMNCIQEMIQPIDPYIDLSDPLWAPTKDLADYFVLGNNHYQIVLTSKPSNVVVYNRRVINEWGFDDPAQLYFNDEWTWDVFYNMCMDFSDGDEDRYALDGYAYVGMFMQSEGQQVLVHDENGDFASNIDSPEIERGMNMLYDLVKNNCTYHEGNNYWALRGNGTFGSGMKEGSCLFYVIGESFFKAPVSEIESIWGDITNGELMFAPLPRDPQGDGNYYLETSFEDINGSLAIVNNAKNPEGAALLAACMRFKKIDPIVIQIDNRQLKEKYHWSDEMIEMSNECKEIADRHVVIDLTGNLPNNLQGAMGNLGGNAIARSADPSSWAQIKEEYKEQVQYYIDELNAMINEYDT